MDGCPGLKDYLNQLLLFNKNKEDNNREEVDFKEGFRALTYIIINIKREMNRNCWLKP